MKQPLAISNALSDASRVRALMLLRGGERRVCHEHHGWLASRFRSGPHHNVTQKGNQP